MNALFALDKLTFEPRKVAKEFRRAGRRVLSKFGYETRAQIREDLERDRRVSAPGDAPHVRKGSSLLRRRVLYHVDYLALSVVVGPAKVASAASTGLAPAALEYGGATRTTVGRGRRRPMAVRVKARPFVRPAAAKHARRLSDWRAAAGL